jgi:hypothetical protein
MRTPRKSRVFLLFAALSAGVAAGGTGCMTAYKKSVGAHTQTVYSRIYATDMNTAWQAALDSLKSTRLDVTNREAGQIQTRWMDNTADKNFTDGDGTTAPYMKAQYRFRVQLSKGVYQGVNAIKITVRKEQVAQRDALEDNRPLESDAIEENTLLYRIGRIISLRTRLAKLEEYRTRQEIQAASGELGPPAEGPADVPPEGALEGSGEELPPPPDAESLQ